METSDWAALSLISLQSDCLIASTSMPPKGHDMAKLPLHRFFSKRLATAPTTTRMVVSRDEERSENFANRQSGISYHQPSPHGGAWFE